MANILLVLDSLNWGGHHAARAVAKICSNKHHFDITDISQLHETPALNDAELVMAWIDSAEKPVYDACKNLKNVKMASRIPGWKGVFRAARMRQRTHKAMSGVVCCNSELEISSAQIYKHNNNVVTITNGVFTDVFTPAPEINHTGKWLWVGRQHDEQKDYGMLERIQDSFDRKIRVKGQKWKDGKVVPTNWPMEMVRRYQAAKGYMRTSRNEGSSNCLLEAMSSGLPVVATPTGVAPRLLDPLSLATSETHIIRAMRMYDDVELAIAHGQRNREVIKSGWRWSQRAAPYLEFFEKCLE